MSVAPGAAGSRSWCAAGGASLAARSPEIPSSSLAGEDGTRWHGHSARCRSRTAARGEENPLLETVRVRLRGFGECVFYSFLKCDEMPGFFTVFLAAGLYQGRQPSRCPPCPSQSSVGTCRAGRAPPPEASCSVSFLLNHLQITGACCLCPSMAGTGVVVETGERGTERHKPRAALEWLCRLSRAAL